MVKALEILKRILKTPQDLFRYSDLELETAIKELETMQDIILEKEEALEIERFMFKNKLEELNNRSCDSCDYQEDPMSGCFTCREYYNSNYNPKENK